VTPLEQFLAAKTFDESVAGVTNLIKLKALHEAARDPSFLKSLGTVEEISRNPEDKNQLFAFSLLCKLARIGTKPPTSNCALFRDCYNTLEVFELKVIVDAHGHPPETQLSSDAAETEVLSRNFFHFN
jgi:hypothetical protein